MAAKQTKIRTELKADDAVVLNANYHLDREDRRFIDNQIRGTQLHLQESLIRGTICSHYVIEENEPETRQPGDVVVSAGVGNRRVTHAIAVNIAVAGVALGIVLLPSPAGAEALCAMEGLVSPVVTGLASGNAGPVRVNTTTGRCERVSSFNTGDFPIGYVDQDGWLSIERSLAVAAGGGGGVNLTSDPPVDVDADAAAVGIAGEAARADHKHQATVAAPVTIGTENAEGSSAALVRADHVHDHGQQSEGSHHALADATRAGFVPSTDGKVAGEVLTVQPDGTIDYDPSATGSEIAVYEDGILRGIRSAINIIASPTVEWTIADNAAQAWVDMTAESTGGGSLPTPTFEGQLLTGDIVADAYQGQTPGDADQKTGRIHTSVTSGDLRYGFIQRQNASGATAWPPKFVTLFSDTAIAEDTEVGAFENLYTDDSESTEPARVARMVLKKDNGSAGAAGTFMQAWQLAREDGSSLLEVMQLREHHLRVIASQNVPLIGVESLATEGHGGPGKIHASRIESTQTDGLGVGAFVARLSATDESNLFELGSLIFELEDNGETAPLGSKLELWLTSSDGVSGNNALSVNQLGYGRIKSITTSLDRGIEAVNWDGSAAAGRVMMSRYSSTPLGSEADVGQLVARYSEDGSTFNEIGRLNFDFFDDGESAPLGARVHFNLRESDGTDTNIKVWLLNRLGHNVVKTITASPNRGIEAVNWDGAPAAGSVMASRYDETPNNGDPIGEFRARYSANGLTFSDVGMLRFALDDDGESTPFGSEASIQLRESDGTDSNTPLRVNRLGFMRVRAITTDEERGIEAFNDQVAGDAGRVAASRVESTPVSGTIVGEFASRLNGTTISKLRLSLADDDDDGTPFETRLWWEATRSDGVSPRQPWTTRYKGSMLLDSIETNDTPGNYLDARMGLQIHQHTDDADKPAKLRLTKFRPTPTHGDHLGEIQIQNTTGVGASLVNKARLRWVDQQTSYDHSKLEFWFRHSLFSESATSERNVLEVSSFGNVTCTWGMTEASLVKGDWLAAFGYEAKNPDTGNTRRGRINWRAEQAPDPITSASGIGWNDDGPAFYAQLDITLDSGGGMPASASKSAQSSVQHFHQTTDGTANYLWGTGVLPTESRFRITYSIHGHIIGGSAFAMVEGYAIISREASGAAAILMQSEHLPLHKSSGASGWGNNTGLFIESNKVFLKAQGEAATTITWDYNVTWTENFV